jgi:putative sterol carrier protein
MEGQSQTPKEFFEKEAPLRFKPEKVKGIDVVAQINLSGPEGGSWIVTIRDQKMTIEEGTAKSPTLTLKVSDGDFMDIVRKKLSAEKAFFTGRIQFNGNLAVALKLRDAGFL